MDQNFGFFKTTMSDSRKAAYYLGCLGGSVFIDFNQTSDGNISLCRISFDGYGCCDITNKANPLTVEMSKKFVEEITRDELDQEQLTALVKKAIKINQKYLWTDALTEYNLIDN